jgi:hypothetical protein
VAMCSFLPIALSCNTNAVSIIGCVCCLILCGTDAIGVTPPCLVCGDVCSAALCGQGVHLCVFSFVFCVCVCVCVRERERERERASE